MAIDYYSAWPAIICIVGLLGLAATPVFAGADTPPTQLVQRTTTIDGLRGFLALAVVFHHASMYRQYLIDGQWCYPPSRVLVSLGPVGVSMFFMVTGFLFWDKMLKANGRPAWVALYLGRLFRIVPLYLAAVALMIAIVFASSGFTFFVPYPTLAVQILSWLSFGYVQPDVNGYAGTSLILVGVVWTLKYEWAFYMALFPLSWIARHRKSEPLFMAAFLLCTAVPLALNPDPTQWYKPGLASLFMIGMACASLQRRRYRLPMSDKAMSAIAVALLLANFLWCRVYSFEENVVLGAVFYLIVSGCTLFGLLLSKPAVRLGDVSYGIYLLQGIALFLVFRPAALRSFALSSPAHYWAAIFLASSLLIAAATVMHVAVERPGIALGRQVIASCRRFTARQRNDLGALAERPNVTT